MEVTFFAGIMLPLLFMYSSPYPLFSFLILHFQEASFPFLFRVLPQCDEDSQRICSSKITPLFDRINLSQGRIRHLSLEHAHLSLYIFQINYFLASKSNQIKSNLFF